MTPCELENVIVGKLRWLDSERRYNADKLLRNRYALNAKHPKFKDLYVSIFTELISNNESDKKRIENMWYDHIINSKASRRSN